MRKCPSKLIGEPDGWIRVTSFIFIVNIVVVFFIISVLNNLLGSPMGELGALPGEEREERGERFVPQIVFSLQRLTMIVLVMMVMKKKVMIVVEMMKMMRMTMKMLIYF